MPRGIALTEEVHRIIIDVFIGHPELRSKPTDFHKEVLQRVHKQIAWADPKWPGKSIIKKELKKERKHYEDMPPDQKELENPWDVGTLVKYNISLEIIPTLLKIQNYHSGRTFTIRQVKWVSNLSALIQDEGALYIFSVIYAHREMSCDLASIKCGTMDIDRFLPDLPIDAGIYYVPSMSDLEIVLTEVIPSKLEGYLGFNLDLSNLTIENLFEYERWVFIFTRSTNWFHLIKDQRKEILLRLQNWVEDNSNNTNKFPSELIRELDPELKSQNILDLAREIDRKRTEETTFLEREIAKLRTEIALNKILVEEANNERSHNQEVSE